MLSWLPRGCDVESVTRPCVNRLARGGPADHGVGIGLLAAVRKAAKTWLAGLPVHADTVCTDTQAIHNLRAICEEHLEGRYAIEVIDLKLNPALAADHQILAVPTLIRKLPESIRVVIGTLSDTERVLVGLDIALPPKSH